MAPFLASLARDDLAPATLRGYRHDLRHFLAWHRTVQDSIFAIKGRTEYQLIGCRQHVVAAGRRPATANRRLDALRRLCRWARGTGALDVDAAGNVRPMRTTGNTLAISCAPREAGYVLGGILDNDTALAIREHASDTRDFTEHRFGLCSLLGITFMPRLKDLPDQVLSRIDRDADDGALLPLPRGRGNVERIIEQWDRRVRLAASLKDGLTPAHVVMQRLVNANASGRLAGALSQLGRLMKTLHILRYIHEAPLRDAIQRQLNRGEFRHILAKGLFFANQGGFRSADHEAVMNRAGCLSLLSNAVLVWNTVHIARIVDQLRAAGHEVKDEDLARVAPLAHAHVIANSSHFQSPRRLPRRHPNPSWPEPEAPCVPHADPVNWQPLSEMLLIASMIDGVLDDTRDHIATLSEARTRPHVLDDATIGRVGRVHDEQLEFVDIYARHIRRWRTDSPTPDQMRELNRMEEQNRQLRAATVAVLTLACELRKGTIDRIMEMSDVELGLQALLGNPPTNRR